VDSAVTTYLCARALGPENVYAFRLPYATSNASSLADAQLVVEALGIQFARSRSPLPVDGYLQYNRPRTPPRQRDGAHALLVLF
jgi:NAD+ synthase